MPASSWPYASARADRGAVWRLMWEKERLHTPAAGIDRERDAGIAGLTLSWNSGVVEGHVNRIKMLKRRMFGRASASHCSASGSSSPHD